MSWLSVALPAVEEAPTILEGLTNLFTHLHNEMAHGGGSTNPITVVEEGLAGVGQIAEALQANTSGGASPPPPPAEQSGEAEQQA